MLCLLFLLAPTAEIVDGVITLRGATSATVRVDGTPAQLAERPAVLGAWKANGESAVFEPRFPLSPGVAYRVDIGSSFSKVLMIPKVERKPSAFVAHAYPSGDLLPENHLRFYLYFSAPMRQGDIYQHIRLLREDGTAVETPWLELEEELWDETNRRLTLLIHPGRIKSGLKPREDLGPVLQPGKKYTLAVDAAWEDERGTPMKQSFRKTYRVGPGTDQKIDIKRWKITPPVGDRPLTVDFDRPLDHALILRKMWVEDAAGKRVGGAVTVSDDETRWRLEPKPPLPAGEYALVADTTLEDQAGNRVDRPFEVDVVRPTEREIKSTTVRLPFRVR